jgi:V/A-type H+-transporting ATPase subunit A
MYCVPVKQVRLLELIMLFFNKAQVCIKLGAPLIKITSLPIRERLARLKGMVKNDDSAVFVDFEQEMRGALDELERSYRVNAIDALPHREAL